MLAPGPNDAAALIEHPLTQGLLFAGLGHGGPGTLLDPDWSRRWLHGTLTPGTGQAADGPQWEWDDVLARWGLRFRDAHGEMNEYAALPPLPVLTTFAAAAWVVSVPTGDMSSDSPIIFGLRSVDIFPIITLTVGANSITSATLGVPSAYVRGDTVGFTTVAGTQRTDDGVPHHLGLARDASGNVSLMVDGAVAAASSMTPDTITIDDPQLGSGRYTNFSSMNCAIFDPLIFDRALTAAEWSLLADPTFHLLRPLGPHRLRPILERRPCAAQVQVYLAGGKHAGVYVAGGKHAGVYVAGGKEVQVGC